MDGACDPGLIFEIFICSGLSVTLLNFHDDDDDDDDDALRGAF